MSGTRPSAPAPILGSVAAGLAVLAASLLLIRQEGLAAGLVAAAAGGLIVLYVERHQRRLWARLAAARAAAEELADERRARLAEMSHELRTPLSAITGLAYLLQSTSLDAAQRGHVERLIQSAETLLAVLDDVLDWSKGEAGMVKSERVPFRLQDVLDHVRTVVGVKARQKGLELAIHVDDAVPVRLFGDPLRLGRVLVNLAGNAVKFTDRGEVVVSVRPDTSSGHGAMLRFAVRDTGVGIDPSRRDRLFRAFSQASTAVSRRYGGTGLGLAICRQLVELMGGTIDVESVPGRGSEFWFTVPLESAGGAEAPAELASEDAPLRPGRVLVVEDHEVNREVAAELLRTMGQSVDVAASGEEAIAALLARPYDLVLMDVHLPGAGGLEAVRRIRSDERLRGVPVVAFTGDTGEDDRARSLEAGMDDHLAKPVEPDELQQVLRRWLGRRRDA